jgi:hypothetical protein
MFIINRKESRIEVEPFIELSHYHKRRHGQKNATNEMILIRWKSDVPYVPVNLQKMHYAALFFFKKLGSASANNDI